MAKRYRLLTRAFMNGALCEPGHVFTLEEGERGPHRAVVHGADMTNLAGDRDADRTIAAAHDEPLYVEVDEGLESERVEMAARHQQERDDLDQTNARRKLAEKHAAELAAFNRKEAAAMMQTRHERERADVTVRQESEQQGFRVRAERSAPAAVMPAETDEQALAARHTAELEALDEKHRAEAEAMEEAQAEPTPEGGEVEQGATPERARSIADEDWNTRPEHGASAADENWPGAPKPGLVGTERRPESGPPTMNRPFVQSGPGHDPNRPTG